MAGAAASEAVAEVEGLPIAPFAPAFAGFAGVNALDSDNVNPSIVGIEPPDQGFCVGGGKVIDIVNLVMGVYDTAGNLLMAPEDLNDFFGVPDFISDPRCYYDPTSNKFILTITDLDMVHEAFSNLLIAVMPGSFTGGSVYFIDTTDSLPGCPCFQDQPLIGVDKNGFYISGNEFPINPNSPFFFGAQIFALNKNNLLNQEVTVGGQEFSTPPMRGNVFASVQPAISIPGQFATNTEYFLSSLDFNGTTDNRIAIWAMTNTCAIPSSVGPPACGGSATLLAPAILDSKAYGVPPSANQKGGPHPLGQLVKAHVEKLQTDDDRMQQVVLMGSTLYSALTTALKVGGATRAGLLYFLVEPSVSSGVVHGTINKSAYVALKGANAFYPAIGVTPGGSAAMGFSFSGGRFTPSVGFLPLTDDLGSTTTVIVAKSGLATYDGASGYPFFHGHGAARWGDYSAAFTDGTSLWFANEFATGSCTLRQYKLDMTCAGTRGPGANWGTYIGRITP